MAEGGERVGHKKDGQKAQKIKMRSEGEGKSTATTGQGKWALEMSTVAPGSHIVCTDLTGLSMMGRPANMPKHEDQAELANRKVHRVCTISRFCSFRSVIRAAKQAAAAAVDEKESFNGTYGRQAGECSK